MTKPINLIKPADYVAAAAMAEEVGKEMLARLDWVILKPKVVLDMGAGAGHFTRLLAERYPEALTIALDAAYPMLKHAHSQDIQSALCGDALALPFKDHSVDLIFANFILPWCGDMEKTLKEWRRVLRPEGLLVFSSLGPDTLKPWHQNIIPDLIDMHDHGDALIRAKFSDPVLDVEYFTLRYRDQAKLRAELENSEMIAEFIEIPSEDGAWNAEYEVIFGNAFGPAKYVDNVADEFGTVKVPLAHLRRR